MSRPRNYILDEHDNPIPEPDLIQWAKWRNTADVRIASDSINGVTVSTVFLGLDHQWEGGPPLIYETMIFGGVHDEFQERYSTRDEAIAGHAVAVAMVKSSLQKKEPTP